MKKILGTLCAIVVLATSLPISAIAAPFSAEYFIATSTTATSTFAGDTSVDGQLDFGLGKGLLLILDGILKLINSNDSGEINILGGSGGSGTGVGGNVTLEAGAGGVSSGAGGTVVLAAGNAEGTDSDGGSIEIYAGQATGSGIPGKVEIQSYGEVRLFSPMSNGISFHDMTSGGDAIFQLGSLTTNHTFAFQNFSGTFGLLEADQVWSGENTFSEGAAATTTVNFGQISSSTSRACFNTKNTTGADISFYFVGTTMVVEGNVCR